MSPEEAVASFLEFTTSPSKASKKLHVSKRDIENASRLALIEQYIKEQELKKKFENWPDSGAGYGQSRPDAPPQAAHSVGPMTEAKRPDPNLISAALAGAPMAAIAGLAGRGAAPAIGRAAPKVAKAVFEGSRSRPWLLGGGALGAATEFLEDKPTVQGAVASGLLGAADVASPPLAIAAQILGYAPEAEANPLLKLFRGIPRVASTGADQVSGLKMAERPKSSASGVADRNTRGAVWTTNNPRVASSYGHSGGIVLPLELTTQPDAILDAGGAHWKNFFYPGAKRVEDFRKLQNPEFEDLLRDPMISTIGVKNIIDPGPGFFELEGDLTDYLADNYLIKDPEVLRYLLTKEKTRFAGGGAVTKLLKSAFPSLSGAWAPGVVKPKGGNWLTGSVEGALGGLKKFRGVDRAVESFEGMSPANIEIARQGMTMDDWIDGPLTKYVKTRMASPEDEVRALAEQGILHFEPRGIRDRAPIMDNVVARRLMSGNPATERAVTPLGEQWERYADSAVLPQEVQELQSGLVGDNPWLSKLRPSDVVYQPDWWRMGSNAEENLGFNHLIDELRNALDPNSGLPRHLQLTPEAVKNMSMEKAVRLVAKINDWRAEQKVAASKELANKASVVREYTENNPKGLRWVELKKNDVTEEKLSEMGLKLEPFPYKGKDLWTISDTQGITQIEAAPTREEALKRFKYGEEELQKQLKYEGDTMGHCVGGYCPDVLEGRSRIFSLRDAKGEPHVTVEVNPQKQGIWDLPDEVVDSFVAAGRPGNIEKFVQENFPALTEPKFKISQIKGKQNRKPKDEYLPFVQDFVRNPPEGKAWADVGDIQNTGLRRIVDAFNSNELKKIQEAGIEVPQWASPEDIDRIGKQVWPEGWGSFSTGMAQGGAVRTYPKPGESPATTGIRGRSPADVVAQFLSEQI